MARRVAGRPAPIGAVTPGNSTTSRSGRTGKVRRSLIYVLLLSIPSREMAAEAAESRPEVHSPCHALGRTGAANQQLTAPSSFRRGIEGIHPGRACAGVGVLLPKWPQLQGSRPDSPRVAAGLTPVQIVC